MSTLTFNSLRAANLSRCARWHPRGLTEWSLSDWGVATAGEMGEALNVIKKLNRERDGIAGNTATVDELKQQLADEIADVAIYLDIMAASEGIDLSEAITSKFNQTSKKVGFPERLLGGGVLCEHCGKAQGTAEALGSTHCNPPFVIQPHAFNGKHPADALNREQVKP